MEVLRVNVYFPARLKGYNKGYSNGSGNDGYDNVQVS